MSISSNSWFGWTLLALAALHRYAFLSCSLSLIMFYTHIHVPIPSHVFLPFHLCRILLCACFVNVFSYECHFFSLSWFSDNITVVWTIKLYGLNKNKLTISCYIHCRNSHSTTVYRYAFTVPPNLFSCLHHVKVFLTIPKY